MHANQHEHSELRAWQTMRIPAFNLIFLTTSPAVHSSDCGRRSEVRQSAASYVKVSTKAVVAHSSIESPDKLQ